MNALMAWDNYLACLAFGFVVGYVFSVGRDFFD